MAAGRNGQSKTNAQPATNRMVASDAGAATVSPEAQRFAALTAEVERLRAALAHWQAQRAAFEQAYARSVAPLWRAVQEARLQTANALERQADAPGWNRAEEAALRELLGQRIDALRSDVGDEVDAGLADLLARHAAAAEPAVGQPEIDAAEQREADAKARRQARLQVRQARRAADAAADPEVERAGPALRDVFRRLASALHPDRETDPARRAAKTALMQQANRAHGERDLLALLELQGRIGAAAGTAGPIPDPQRLVHYNRLLVAQAGQLAAQIDRVEAEFRSEIGLPAGRGLNPARLVIYARQDARALRDLLAALQAELRVFDDADALRDWLRTARRHRRDIERLR